MSKSEKRSLKLYIDVSSSKKKEYLIDIFDKISDMKSYDDNKLYKETSSGISKSEFSRSKSNLKKMILDSLYLLNDLDAHKRLIIAQILINKKLYDEALKKLLPVLEETHPYYHSFKIMAYRLLAVIESLKGQNQQEETRKQQKYYTSAINELTDLKVLLTSNLLYLQLRELAVSGMYESDYVAKNKKLTARFRDFLTQPIKNVDVQLTAYYGLLLCYDDVYETDNSLSILETIRKTLTANKTLNTFPRTLNLKLNDIYIKSHEKNLAIVQDQISKLRLLDKEIPPYYKEPLQYKKMQIIVRAYINCNQIISTEDLNTIRQLLRSNKYVEHAVELRHFTGAYFFSNLDYKAASDVYYLYMPPFPVDSEIPLFVHDNILWILTNHKLGIHSVAKNQLVSLSRKLKREGKSFDLLNSFLSLIRTYLKTQNTSKTLKTLSDISIFLEVNKQHILFGHFFDYLRIWIPKEIIQLDENYSLE